ncbi:MAG: FAD-dependent oxidoreductase, partial [Frankiaceae bacterium]|nr:FAD-dependent oxidoreductase [Arenimonas sp.]
MRFETMRIDDGCLAGTGAFIEIAADAVFKAIGQSMDAAGLGEPLAQKIERSGDKIYVDAQFRTALAGVYAGGDCVAPGQDLTVQAVQHGKLAAHAIHHDIQSTAEAAWPT